MRFATVQSQTMRSQPAARSIGSIWPQLRQSVTGAGNYLIPKADVCYRWLRIVYTKTTSAGGALITVNFEGLGY